MKEYKVWVYLEEHNLKTDEYQGVDLGFPVAGVFENVEAATKFAEQLQSHAAGLTKDKRGGK